MNDDAFTSLVNAGIPVNTVQKYIDDRVPLDEVWAAVSGMLERGMGIAEILREDGKPQEPPAEAPPTLSTISATVLQQKDIPPVRWIVQDLLPAGLTILASPPKFGKSWMAMCLCLSVAMGGSFLGYRCHKCGTLYLALEDSERRLKSRMQKILVTLRAPPGFDFATQSPTLSTGLIDVLEGYIVQHPEAALIVVDTLQKVRDVGGGKDVYGRDYSDIATLKRFADSHNVAVVLIHHLRKMKDDSDPFNMISGTNGISGASDCMMVLTREKRGDDATTLSVVGRDVEQLDLILRFNKSSCLWENMGDVDAFAAQQTRREYADSPIVRTVKKLLERSPDGWTGSAQNLIDSGRFIARTTLADSPRSLSSKLKDMGNLFFEFDGIVYEHKKNGSGGGKHRFYYVDAPQFEEMEQSEIDPFSEG